MGNEKKKYTLKKVIWRVIQALLLITGLLLLFFGISLIFLAPRIIDIKIREHKNIAEGSDLYKLWKDPDYTYQFDVYVYSVKNPDQILNGSKPELATIGPYAYRVLSRRAILGFGNGTVRYQNTRNMTFDENASCAECLPRRKVWIPNIIYQKFVEVASNPVTAMVQSALVSQTPFLDVAVEDILFKGYKDPYFEEVCTIPFVDFICESVLELPERIGFLMNRNTTGKVVEVSTGEFDGGATIGNIITWDGEHLLPESWWGSIQAREINGTDGGLYRPLIKKTDTLYIFVPDLCRSIHVTFDEEFEYKGILAYRFTSKEDLLDPAIPGNEGFCRNSGKEFFSENETCLPKGLIDISRCYQGTPPVVWSFPNFLYADQKVKDSIIGLNESSVAHDGLVIEVEPRTGALLRAFRRSQVNIAMWKGQGITYGNIRNIPYRCFRGNLTHLRSSIIPLLAEYQLVEIGDHSLAALRNKVINVEEALQVLCFVSIFIGALFLCAAVLSELLLKTKTMKKLLGDNSQKVVTHIAVQPVSNGRKNVAFRPDTS